MQFPRARRLLFMFAPSRIPLYYLSAEFRSEPAKSIKVSLEVYTEEFSNYFLVSMFKKIIA